MNIKVNDWVQWGLKTHPRIGYVVPRSELYDAVKLQWVRTFSVVGKFVVCDDTDLRLFMPAAAAPYFEQFVGDEGGDA